MQTYRILLLYILVSLTAQQRMEDMSPLMHIAQTYIHNSRTFFSGKLHNPFFSVRAAHYYHLLYAAACGRTHYFSPCLIYAHSFVLRARRIRTTRVMIAAFCVSRARIDFE
jgi:hypothetical protein